ncbi:MAG: NAD(P)H-dependent oxidoreductase subunit E [Planctomycetota bacterium]
MIRIGVATQSRIARWAWIAAAIAASACAGVLVVDHVRRVRAEPGEKVLLAELQERAAHDSTQIKVLEEEWDRLAEAALARKSRTDFVANALVVSVVAFLLAAKWSRALGQKRLPRREKIVAERARTPNGRLRSRANRRDAAREVTEKKSPSIEPLQPDLAFVDDTIRRLGRGPEAVIPILQAVQAHERYLDLETLQYICRETRITPARITGVASFYKCFRRTPVGEHVIKVCHGTACHVAGAVTISEEIRRELGLGPGEDTDPERLFTVQPVACLGCCTLAPVMQVDGTTYGHLAPDTVADMLADRRGSPQEAAPRHPQVSHHRMDRERRKFPRAESLTSELTGEIRVGLGSCCVAGGSDKVHEALERAVALSGARAKIKRVGCVGMCHRTPLVETIVAGERTGLYANVGPHSAAAIVHRHFKPTGLRRRLFTVAGDVIGSFKRNGEIEPIAKHSIEVRDPPVAAFLGPQKRIATEHCGCLDPADLEEYRRHDGFKALERCLEELAPGAIIEELRRSGLRGRGGAGFPTGDKWARVRAAASALKVVICNGDEGDPGAFMDRMLMESFPYRVIEGMTIAAHAVGAQEGYFYIRAEYPLALARIREAIARCEERGLLGEDILGKGVRLHLQIMEGAGAFVCGEETALLASIEGKRGSPRLRPPYPAEQGLWGRPTLVNNVETYANVPWIVRNGAAAFAALGTPASKGTKVFALAGKVNRGGLIEVPMGVTIRQIVFEIGGGIKEGRSFKAVQIGGPSGGCIPAELADTPVDYEALGDAGAIMGSGGLVVMDDSSCMVDIARYFLSFTQDQSCGQCTYCRVGTRRMLDILDRLCAGQARKGDLETLEELARTVRQGSLCGLGKTAPNPVLSTLRYFRDEYQAHIEGRCPAGKCKALIRYRVTAQCIGCTLCAQRCPTEAIAFTPYQQHEIDETKCTRCDICRTGCPEHAIEIVPCLE